MKVPWGGHLTRDMFHGTLLILLLHVLLTFILLGCFPQTYGLLTGAPDGSICLHGGIDHAYAHAYPRFS